MTHQNWQFWLASACFSLLLAGVPSQAQRIIKPIAPQFTPDPLVYAGTTEGNAPMQNLVADAKVAGNCQGLASPNPSHVLTITKTMSSLSLRVTAPNPITILVRGKDGILCRSGLNPEIMGAWSEGKYDIWIGSVSGDRLNYRLSLSEGRQSP
jgi:hypothetical protein